MSRCLTWDEVQLAGQHAEYLLEKVKEKYGNIRVYLMFSKGGGQGRVSASKEELVDTFSEIFMASESSPIVSIQQSNSEIIKELKSHGNRKNAAKFRRLNEQIASLTEKLLVDPEVEIILRWESINYDVNNRLRHDDELVDVSRTPQIGGIKISFGTLCDLLDKARYRYE